MAKKQLTAKEKEAQLATWQLQLDGIARLLSVTPELEAYREDDWLWVTGNTKPHAAELKFYGMKFCRSSKSKHYQQWYLPAPKWVTDERLAREAEAQALKEMALEQSLEEQSALERAAELVGRLTSAIENMALDCDAEVYAGLCKVEQLLIEAL